MRVGIGKTMLMRLVELYTVFDLGSCKETEKRGEEVPCLIQ